MKKLRLQKIVSILLIVALISILNPIRANADWKQDNKGWWYTEGNSWVTGWKMIGANWYYFHPNGYMATIENINGYFVNSSGVWTNEITESEAKQLILKEDDEYISKLSKNGNIVLFDNSGSDGPTAWDFPNESYYSFVIESYYNEEDFYEIGVYLVGKESKNIYIIGQPYSNAYQIKNNQKVKTFKCLLDNQTFIEWR